MFPIKTDCSYREHLSISGKIFVSEACSQYNFVNAYFWPVFKHLAVCVLDTFNIVTAGKDGETFDPQLSPVDLAGPIFGRELRARIARPVRVVGVGESVGAQEPPHIAPVVNHAFAVDNISRLVIT